MNPQLSPPNCPYCGQPARLGTTTMRYRRGERVVAAEAGFWECPLDCEDPDGERPFRFEDGQLMSRNDAAAREAWLSRYGEAMPASGRPGRKTPARRTAPVQVRLTEEERARLDRDRGEATLADSIRDAVFSRPASPRAPCFPLAEGHEPAGPHRKAS